MRSIVDILQKIRNFRASLYTQGEPEWAGKKQEDHHWKGHNRDGNVCGYVPRSIVFINFKLLGQNT